MTSKQYQAAYEAECKRMGVTGTRGEGESVEAELRELSKELPRVYRTCLRALQQLPDLTVRVYRS